MYPDGLLGLPDVASHLPEPNPLDSFADFGVFSVDLCDARRVIRSGQRRRESNRTAISINRNE
jgi:hypothetical protein